MLLFLFHYGCACYSRCAAGNFKTKTRANIESSLNFEDDEHCKLLERVVNLERTEKALELENNALKAQLSTTINKVKTKTNEALLDEQEQYMRGDCFFCFCFFFRSDEI